jgi:hypothetical protein
LHEDPFWEWQDSRFGLTEGSLLHNFAEPSGFTSMSERMDPEEVGSTVPTGIAMPALKASFSLLRTKLVASTN